MSISDTIKNARLTSIPSLSLPNNEPSQYQRDRQFQYYNTEYVDYIFLNAQYSTDFIQADVQGLSAEDPEAWIRVYLRFSDLVKASAAGTNGFDDFKMILLCGLAPQPEMDSAYQTEDGRYWVEPEHAYTVLRAIQEDVCYIKKGTKIIAMGSTWLVTNPMNMSDSNKAVIQRCNATWRYLDYYGNVCSEPLCIYPQKMRANDPDSQRSTMITKGYFDGFAQYNKATRQLRNNTRMILGSSAYMLSGFTDWSQEFTDDDSSINLVYFSLRYDEPNDAKDDMVTRVADGKLFNWELEVFGKPLLLVGQSGMLSVTSKRNDEIVTGTTEQPISYIFSSADESIATVDEDGRVTAVSEGDVDITVALAQNPNIKQIYKFTVDGTMSATQVRFETTIPYTLSMFETVTLVAGYYEDGAKTGEPVEWTLTNADKNSYTYVLNADNSITIKCWAGSVESLVITASHGSYSDSAEIYLRGI